MTLKCALTIPALLAGVTYITTLSSTRAQPVHGESIGAAAPAVPARPAASSVAAADGAVLKADFDTLASFPFAVPDAAPTNRAALEMVMKQIPDAIRKLDGKVVRIRGFMMPVREEAGKATEFLITRGQPSCCFGGATTMTEFVTVTSAGKGVTENMDDAVAIEGTLHVALVVEGGSVVGVYKMDGGKMVESKP